MATNIKGIRVYFNSNNKSLGFFYNCCNTYEGNCIEAHDAMAKSWASTEKFVPYSAQRYSSNPVRVDPSEYNRKFQSVVYGSNYDKYLRQKSICREWRMMMENALIFVRLLPPTKHRLSWLWDGLVEMYIREPLFECTPRNNENMDASNSQDFYTESEDEETESQGTLDS